MLILVSTPIGNLSDITLRAIEALKECDYILCEDTRHSAILLSKYSITTPTKSYHKFNESKKALEIIEDIKNGKVVCLISDAGTPAIADPGADLVKKCIAENIEVSSLPGPCAAIAALTVSGFNTENFRFVGFLSKKDQGLKTDFSEILHYSGTTICYESPHRLINFLNVLREIDPDREVVVARELTKKFETIYRGTANDLFIRLENTTIKGEIVILISENPLFSAKCSTDLSPEEHVNFLINTYQITKSEAIKISAQMRGIPKRSLYRDLL